ncbi:MAG TPA: sigma 54-interacting transcriptional regulator [Polyangiaceae bacterium]|jgi:DNA-binding NtrC family response regulator|nr:sigma 54-interacting transcriptional regulator [Polyangiaceae bacterium]
MPRVIAKLPDASVACEVDLGATGAVLIGRDPDPATLERLPEGVSKPVAILRVDVPSVSGNHVLVWSVRGEAFARDLESKNGTWLRLPEAETARVGANDVILQLSPAAEQRVGADEPEPASWTNRFDFASSLAQRISIWLKAAGVDARVDAGEGTDDSPVPGRIALATGESLSVAPTGTAHASWSRLMERLWRWVTAQNAIFEAEERTRGEGMILASARIRSSHREIVDAAQGGTRTLLITGPSGAGKEVLAEVFHRHARRAGPFIAVNCSAFTKDFLRSELFGAEAGSFTGATRRIIGAVERAQEGTLFLDEIGDMPLDVQPMLLRFLDGRREYERLGQYGRTQHADVRVVAATNRDLRAAVRAGTFRDDLWYRLSVTIVDVPPLRLRWNDLLAYLDSVRQGSHSIRACLSTDALEVLRAHSWDGNFRELANFVRRLPRGASPGSIDAKTCQAALDRGALNAGATPLPIFDAAAADWSSLMARSIAAFVDDHAREPSSWDDQKEWNEKYLKPLVFYHMSGADRLPAPADESGLSILASRVATRLQADRGTARTQLARYFQRYKA